MYMNSDYQHNRNLSIKAVGDIAAGDYSMHGLGVCSYTKKYGCDYPFEKLNEILSGADLLLGNLEGALSERVLNDDLRLCGLPGVASTLGEIGFDILSVANNHAFDHGAEVFAETVDYCRKAGIEVCGLRGDAEYYSQPVVIYKNSMTIGVLAYNWIGLEKASEMEKYVAVVKDSVVNYTWNRNKKADLEAQKQVHDKNRNVISDIRRLREDVDVLILMPHWGYEWGIYPPYGVTLEARTFIDAGVDLIIGSHPHVIQGIERYKSGVIAYSLGNFLFDAPTEMFNTGMVLKCDVAIGAIPEYSYDFVKRSKNFQPVPACGADDISSRKMVMESSEVVISEDAPVKLDDEIIYKEYEKQYNYLKRKKVVFLFKAMLMNPKLVIPILGKVRNLVVIILMRLQGKKVRW